MLCKGMFKKASQGFTFVELLVALVVNVILLSALLSVFSNNMTHYNDTISSDSLNEQLQSVLQLMENDIRRAGYWGNASSDIKSGQNNNPFMAGATDISVPNSSCILFSYDYDSNGSVSSITSANDDEHYGFRLNGTSIQTRPPGAPFNCGAAANTWENVTNPHIVNITNLSFTLSTTTVPVGQAHPTMTLRTVTISVTGQLVNNASISKTYTQTVKVQNDKYAP